jgi:hypothetical protein
MKTLVFAVVALFSAAAFADDVPTYLHVGTPAPFEGDLISESALRAYLRQGEDLSVCRDGRREDSARYAASLASAPVNRPGPAAFHWTYVPGVLTGIVLTAGAIWLTSLLKTSL